jgi:hypothetical protein
MLSHGAQLKTGITLVPQCKQDLYKSSKALELYRSPITALQESSARMCTLHSQIMRLAVLWAAAASSHHAIQ